MKHIGVLSSAVLVLTVLAVAMNAGCSDLPAGETSDRPQEPAEEGKLVFVEDFGNLSNWVSEGPYAVELRDGRLYVKTTWGELKVGQYVWCRENLPADFRIEYDFTPLSESGFFLIFFCVEGVKGEDILAPELLEQYMSAGSWADYQDFDKYTSPPNRRHESRIRCYHVSYRRGERANCNIRKNPGLNLLRSSNIDQLLPKDETVHVVLVKRAGRVLLTVGGRTFMDYTDEGEYYTGGRFGFRQVYDSEGTYDNLKLYDLSAEK